MTESVVSVEPDATVAEVLSRMEKHGIHELPVMANGAAKGWVSYRTLLQRSGVVPQTKIAPPIIESRPTLLPEASVYEAADLMLKSNVRALHVSDGRNGVQGILTRTDLLRAVVDDERLAQVPVTNVMVTELETAGEDEPIDRAVHRLRILDIRQMLILDRHGRLAGYAALEDLLRTMSAENAPHHFGGRQDSAHAGSGPRKEFGVSVKSLVRPAVTLGPSASLADAGRAMIEKGTNVVAIVDEEGFAVGVLSRSNLVERIANLKPSREGVMCQIVGLGDHADEIIKAEIYRMAQNTLQKISNEVKNLEFLNLHYKVYKAKAEGDQKFSLSLHLGTGGRFVVQKADAWDPIDATRVALDLLEQRVNEKKELRLEMRKGTPRRKAAFYSAT